MDVIRPKLRIARMNMVEWPSGQVPFEKFNNYLIIGLDPAGPLFSRNNTRSIRLFEAEDAVFVDAYHTNGGDTIKQFGTKEDRAHTDIRFNGGALQPACEYNTVCPRITGHLP